MFVQKIKFVFIGVRFHDCIARPRFSHKFEFSFLNGILVVLPFQIGAIAEPITATRAQRSCWAYERNHPRNSWSHFWD